MPEPQAASPLTLGTVAVAIEGLWPAAGAEEWDAVGVVVGSPDHLVNHIRLVVDVVPDTVVEASQVGADLIIAHHPLLLRPVHTVAEDRYKGNVITSLIRGGMALITAHTNADVVPTGTSRRLGSALGLDFVDVISPSAAAGHGIGMVGVFGEEKTLYQVATLLGELLPHTSSGIRVSGDPTHSVRKVALCAGAGDSLLGHPSVLDADLYITSDLRHHPASEVSAQRAIGQAPALIDISHFAAEWLWLEQARDQLAAIFPEVTVTVSDLVTDPWDFIVHPG
jgi:dinuclear metal center YbgI/SA1388 family protein